jgi:uncharacterized protein (DUF1778 family)
MPMENMTNQHGNARAPQRTRRLRLRLREHELSKLNAVAAQRGQYVAEFVREASLAAAQAMMDSVERHSEPR